MVRARHPLPRAARRGALIPLVAFGLMVLLGVLAFALDGGMLLSERRRAQAVADAAALAAAISLYQNYGTDQGLDPNGTAQQSALAYAAANGYSNDGTQSTVTVNIPPQAGDHAGKACYAEVIVQFNQPRYFSAVFGSGTIPVGARSVASGLSAAPNNVGLLLLDPWASPSLSGSGSADLDVKSGNVIIDSSSSRAADLSGSASVTAPEIDITGSGPGYTTSGAAQFNTTPTGGNIKTGKVATADPLVKLPPPDPKTLTVQSSQALQIHGQVSLQPGIYKGGDLPLREQLGHIPAGHLLPGRGRALGLRVVQYDRQRRDVLQRRQRRHHQFFRQRLADLDAADQRPLSGDHDLPGPGQQLTGGPVG
jgi:Flp pilus assembly protein TadG